MTEESRVTALLSRASWALCAVPLVGAVELVMHLKQTSTALADSDWRAAREVVKADFHTGDLVVFAPFWTDPLGREFFGDELAPMKNEGRPDETRYPRAFEVSARGHHDPAFEHWKKVSEKPAGRLVVTLFENPSPAKVRTDLVSILGPERVTVSLAGPAGDTACAYHRGVGQPGGLGVPQGPAVPGDKFSCTSGYVGVAVLHDIDHHPHLCIFATVTGAALKVRFKDVVFGDTLHGHGGVQWVTERNPSNERIQLSFSAFDRPIGTHAHKVGTGWTNFEFLTTDIAGKIGDLVAEIASPGGAGRQFCFEADTR